MSMSIRNGDVPSLGNKVMSLTAKKLVEYIILWGVYI